MPESFSAGWSEWIRSHPQPLGLVTKELPLLSNLSAWQNIALIKQYHENWGVEKSYQTAIALLTLLGMDSVAHKRHPELSEEQVFFIKLIRAVMLSDADLAVDRPFRQVGESLQPELLRDHLKALAGYYRECFIFDYQSNEKKYLLLNF